MSIDWFRIWIFAGPVLLPILATALAIIAGLKRWMFLCRTLLIPSVLVSALSGVLPFGLEFGDLGHGREAGLLLIIPPVASPIIFIVIFALCCGGYLAVRAATNSDKKPEFTVFDGAGLIVSVIAICLYFALVAALLIW